MTHSYIVNDLEDLIITSVNHAIKRKISTILIFSRTKDSVLMVKEALDNVSENEIKVVCVTFPINQVYLTRNEEEEIVPIEIELHDSKIRDDLRKQGVEIISGMMPFDDIITRSSEVNMHSLIEESLTIVHRALPLAVEAVLMATDAGLVVPGEKVVSIVNGISIETNGTNSRYLFHPQKGMEIDEIISKIKVD